MARVKSVAERSPEPPLKIGLFGGMFNPPHIGHLIAAQEVQISLDLDTVYFIPAGQPPHRENPATPGELRLEMTRRAVEDNPQFKVSNLEIVQPEISYSYNTVRQFKKTFPGAQLFLLVGADQLNSFTSWKNWKELLKTSTVVGINRPGTDPDNLPQELADSVITVKIPEIAISSRKIRRRLQNGRPVKYLVPAAVNRYLEQQEIYCETNR